MRHKLCRSFHPWCPGVKNRCLCPIVMGLFSCGLCWVWFLSILCTATATATATATGLLFSATFFFSLLVFISFGGSLGWYIFFYGWSECYPSFGSTATVCFILFVGLFPILVSPNLRTSIYGNQMIRSGYLWWLRALCDCVGWEVAVSSV